MTGTVTWDLQRQASDEFASGSGQGTTTSSINPTTHGQTAQVSLQGGVEVSQQIPGQPGQSQNLQAETPTTDNRLQSGAQTGQQSGPLQGSIVKSAPGSGSSASTAGATAGGGKSLLPASNVGQKPLQGNLIGSNGTPTIDPHHPEMFQSVPSNFPPDQLPKGYYVARGTGDKGYLMPIEGCIPDPGSDLVLANVAALGMSSVLRACGALIGGAIEAPAAVLPELPPQDEMVWVNNESGIIWRQFQRYFGKTNNGHWTTLQKALANKNYRLPKGPPTMYNQTP